ncbi:E3 ubiquitin ligase BIG BROTHER-related isoform X1 [Lycium ferocissimum]|uniref:E3 ubiquitin ligase BIG BROTHER-related isoform X1 n=2 Tax=Lycium ferocissimum TaxID=112874 RepID=UPI002814C842|nr:E3 ubiquitin ligase BIG BROTHER-related isoform X1 [Lycium ferocissimum]XP_059276479.1 E3 ubiquitin ligase BIG BROTHER-related isoform X1 [Lycium ferocissimum]
MADEEQRNPTTRRTPLSQIDEDRVRIMLSMIESESEDEEITASDEEFLGSEVQDFEFEFYDDGYEDDDEDMEEDDVDPDELSYEELIALGEFVGVENRGLSEAEISKSLHSSTFQSNNSKTLIDKCVVCQLEYEEGEKLVALPCDHHYHSDCIKTWLQIKKICPICNDEISSANVPKDL